MSLAIHSEFCAETSVERGEPIVGTAAASTSVWLGVELSGAWPRDAWKAQCVPERVRLQIAQWGRAIPGFRPQALRRPGRALSGAPAAFVALTGPDRDAVFELSIGALEDLAALDLPSMVTRALAGEDVAELRPVAKPMVWVCVHGKRDRCCAKLGAPVYEAAVAHGAAEVWQTSHLGGHRFAATLLCLPRGVCYGRVLAAEVPALIDAHVRGSIFDLQRLRGRSCWSGAGQAAEHFLREATGDLDDANLSVRDIRDTERGTEVDVHAASGEATVVVQKRGLGVHRRPSCDKPQAQVKGWFLVELQRG